MQNTNAVASFVSSDVVQLRLELGTVVDAEQTTQFPDGLTYGPNDGWISSNGSWIGRVGGRNQEYWTPVDQFQQSSIADLFDRADSGNGTLIAPADDASRWTVLVNGVAATVEGVSRKSNILDTAETNWFGFDFRLAENVFLDLATPLSAGDTVSIRFDDVDFQTVTASYAPAQTISEAVHVNLTGFDPQGNRFWNYAAVRMRSGMKASFQAARFNFPRMDPLEGSLLARLRAMRLRMARFSGPLPVRFRARSSFMTTSSTQ